MHLDKTFVKLLNPLGHRLSPVSKRVSFFFPISRSRSLLGTRTLLTRSKGHRYERSKGRYDRGSWHRYERSDRTLVEATN